jgi:basic amino acid/polyamine antiporter, APA family
MFRRKCARTMFEGGDLRRCLNFTDLLSYGINNMVGAGIFVVIGVGAIHAGSGVVVSFLIAANICVLSGNCFAEFASSIPSSASGYAYLYASLGKISS